MPESARLPPPALALCLVVATGVALRMLGLQRGLWIDEAWVVESVRSPALHDMFFYQGWAQTTPPGVLLFLRAFRPLTGASPETFRLVPFAIGIVTLAVLVRLCRRLLSAGFALLGAIILACSPEILWYATEIKQYAFDLLAAAVLLSLGVAFVESPTRARMSAWFGAYCVLAGLSYTVAFYLPALLLTVIIVHRQDSGFVSPREIALHGAVAVLVLLVFYAVFARPNAAAVSLYEYWRGGFLLGSDKPLTIFLARAVGEVFAYLPIFIQGRLAAGLLVMSVLLGLASLWRTHAPWHPRAAAMFALFALPLLTVFAANALGVYPLADFRLVHFLIPNGLLSCLFGIEFLIAALCRLVASRRGCDCLLMAGLLLAAASAWQFTHKKVHTVLERRQWDTAEDMRTIARFLHQVDGLRRPIYVHSAMRQHLAVYLHQFPLAAPIHWGDSDRPCCIPGSVWSQSDVEPTVFKRHVAEIIKALGPGEFYVMTRYSNDKLQRPPLYRAEFRAQGCEIPWTLAATTLRLLKISCGSARRIDTPTPRR